MKAFGWAWGLSQGGRWWIIQTSGQITEDPPLCRDTVESSRPANSEPLTHCPFSLPGIFIYYPFPLFPFFHCRLLLIPLPLGKVSINWFWKGFVKHNSLFLFRWRVFKDLFWWWFKVKSADRLILIDFISVCCSLKEAVQSWWEGQQMARVQPESIVGETIKTS